MDTWNLMEKKSVSNSLQAICFALSYKRKLSDLTEMDEQFKENEEDRCTDTQVGQQIQQVD